MRKHLRCVSAGQKVGAGGGVESRQKRLGFLSFGFQNRRETSNSTAFANLKRKTTRKHLFFAGKKRAFRKIWVLRPHFFHLYKKSGGHQFRP